MRGCQRSCIDWLEVARYLPGRNDVHKLLDLLKALWNGKESRNGAVHRCLKVLFLILTARRPVF